MRSQYRYSYEELQYATQRWERTNLIVSDGESTYQAVYNVACVRVVVRLSACATNKVKYFVLALAGDRCVAQHHTQLRITQITL